MVALQDGALVPAIAGGDGLHGGPVRIEGFHNEGTGLVLDVGGGVEDDVVLAGADPVPVGAGDVGFAEAEGDGPAEGEKQVSVVELLPVVNDGGEGFLGGWSVVFAGDVEAVGFVGFAEGCEVGQSEVVLVVVFEGVVAEEG